MTDPPSLWEIMCMLDISDKIALVNCVLTGLFLLATVVSVICAFKVYHHQKDRSRKEAACDLAKYYAENIIQRNIFVTNVLYIAGLEARTKDFFPYDELAEFTQDEMISLLAKQNISYEEIKEEFLHPAPQAILKAMLLHTSSDQERKELFQAYGGFIQKKADDNQLDGFFLRHEFFDKMDDYLNDLEWFSMSCRYRIADEEILYQSLHQSFLSSIWQMYFYICYRNITNEDKLYTNVIWLFSEWHDRMKNIQKEAQDQRLEAQREVEEAEHQRAEAENKLKGAKAKVHSGKPLK